MSLSVLFIPFFNKKAIAGKFTELSSKRILETLKRLEERIGERFPESGLLRVCGEFRQLANGAEELTQHLVKPVWPVRIAAWALSSLILGLVIWAFAQAIHGFGPGANGMSDFLQGVESGINELIFLSLAIYFLVNLETRLKRHTALATLHQLRSIAHVVDMHQLTKDPAHVLGNFSGTQSSPQRSLSRLELTRYLDYCSEMLALVSKIAALFAQNMEDPVVLDAVNDLESLTQGLAGKIWQKIMILDLSDRES